MKATEKKLKQTIIKNKKKNLSHYFISFAFESREQEYVQIPKYLYKTNLKKSFDKTLSLKFPFVLTKNLKAKYDLFINDKLNYLSPFFYNLNFSKFTNNKNLLFNKISPIAHPTTKICKLIISERDH